MLPTKYGQMAQWITNIHIQDLQRHYNNTGENFTSGLSDTGTLWEPGNLFGVVLDD